MKTKTKLVPLIAVLVLAAAVVLVTCAVVLEPLPVYESVTVEAGSEAIPLEKFSKEGKEVTLLTDISSISLNHPGEYKLEFLYKKKICTSSLKIVDTTPPEGTAVSHTIYNDEVLTPEDFVTDIRDITKTTIAFAQIPDFTKVGEQTVRIQLTDAYQNVGIVEAKLTVIADTTAPIFSPMEDLKVNIGQTVSYRDGITVTDERDGQLSYTVDAGNVNLEKEGTYAIIYEATDSCGNATRVERKIYVSATLIINQELVDEMARDILSKITNDSMSAHDKITAIYNYVRKNIAYSSSPEKDIPNAAYKAMTKGKGDCYNYFSLTKVLLDQCGIDNLPVERYNSKSSHFWLLVNIGTGWYHYDTSPQSLADPYRCFMKTDAEVTHYAEGRSDGRKDYYQIDVTKYPDRATESYKAP